MPSSRAKGAAGTIESRKRKQLVLRCCLRLRLSIVPCCRPFGPALDSIVSRHSPSVFVFFVIFVDFVLSVITVQRDSDHRSA